MTLARAQEKYSNLLNTCESNTYLYEVALCNLDMRNDVSTCYHSILDTLSCDVSTSDENEPEKVLLSWSGGKDSALSLYELQKIGTYDVVALLTTVTEGYDRTSMHGVRRVLLEQQADSVGIPLEKVFLPKTVSYEEYESIMQKVCENYLHAGISTVVFGDIFLEDVRKYREKNLEKIGMKALFPLWGKDTVDLAHAFINLGFKAITTCIDSHVLDKDYVGRDFDEKFLSELPPSVDPCGEHGEFHSFVYDGPVFRKKISCTRGEVVFREKRFYYCDLLPQLPF